VNGSRARNRILFALITVLSLAGIVDSAISLGRHYAKSATTYCDFSQKFSCDIVNRSEYSEIAGIPVAGVGVAGYAALFVLSTFWRSRTETPLRLLAASLAGLLVKGANRNPAAGLPRIDTPAQRHAGVKRRQGAERARAGQRSSLAAG